MRRSWGLMLVAAVLGVVLPGCFRESLRDEDSLRRSNRQKICVRTTDGFRYWFDSGDYAFGIDSTGAKVIEGKGRRDHGDNKSSEEFKGRIPLATIERVSVSEGTPWLYFSLGVLSGVLLVFIWFGLILSGIRMG